MSFAVLLLLSTVLGVASFGAGMVPLILNTSRRNVARIATIGSGLLLGAAMGVIIPEGIEAISDNSSSGSDHSHSSPTFTVGASLLTGFTLMLIIEQIIGPAFHDRHHHQSNKYQLAPTTPGDAPLPASEERDEIDELEMEFNEIGVPPIRQAPRSETKKNPYLLTLGLVVHSVADGLALGAASIPTANSTSQSSSETSNSTSGLSLVVFFALAMHKAPTAVALTSNLLTQLSPRQIRPHLVLFSITSPLAAVLTYFGLLVLGGQESVQSWTGVVLTFSGGTFLYVATVLTGIPAGHSDDGDMSHLDSFAEFSPKTRVSLLIIGMFTPVLLSRLLGHGH